MQHEHRINYRKRLGTIYYLFHSTVVGTEIVIRFLNEKGIRDQTSYKITNKFIRI